MNAPARPILCLVTSLRRLGSHDRVVEQVRTAAAAGVSLIQVREPGLPARDLYRLVGDTRAAVQGTSSRVVVNDRLDVAVAGGAHGVHLRADSLPADRVRAWGGPLLIGRSIHSAVEAAELARQGAVDYLVFGTVFPTGSKPPEHPVAGLEGLAAAVRAAGPVPVLAIGGITVETAAAAAAAGAAGIAAIGLFSSFAGDRPSLHDVATDLRAAFAPTERVGGRN